MILSFDSNFDFTLDNSAHLYKVSFIQGNMDKPKKKLLLIFENFDKHFQKRDPVFP